jgi:WD40 repeat protein
MRFMRAAVRWLVVILALLAGAAAWAQERRGFLGAELKDVTKAEAEKLGWEAPRGARIGKLSAGGPAAAAGILPDDIVLSLDGQEVGDMAALVEGVATKGADTQVRLRLLRSGRERTVNVTLGTRPEDVAAARAARKDLPILMLDPGGHMGLIKGLAFTPDGRQLVSAGDDKVIRLWDWQAGKTVRTFRGQVGPGAEGRNFALALSPDARLLAAGGWMAQGAYGGGTPDPAVADIRLYDFATGKVVALLKGHTNIVNTLVFSRDGKRLISGGALGDLAAIVWDVDKRALLYRLQGHKAEIYAVGFTPDGERAVTGSYDTTLKLWSLKDGKEIATLAGHKNGVQSLGVSPVDGTIASGSMDGEIRLWDGSTGRYLRTLANQATSVGGLTFSPDGKRLLSTCAQRHPCYDHVWDLATGREIAKHKIDDNIVIAATLSPDGGLAATGGGYNNEIHVWDFRTGQTRKVLAGTGSPRWATGFSADGRRIAWGNTWRSNPKETISPLEFQLRLPEAGQGLGEPEPLAPDAAATFLRARTTYDSYSLSHREGGSYGYADAILDIKKDGRTLVSIERAAHEGYRHLAYSFTPDGQTILSGASGGLITAYDLKGQKLGDFVGHEGDIWAVTPSADGRLLLSGSHDQTVRLWNLKTRELIVTLFHSRDGEWVMWTPQGYYMGSPGADKIVGWQINKGPANAAEYVGAEQLRQHLNRPDVVEKAIVLASAERAVREAPGTSFKLSDLLGRPVPKFKIVSPVSGSVEHSGRASVKIAIEPTPDAVRLIRVQVNGRQVAEDTPDIGSGGFGAGERVLAVPLAKGRNDVRVALTNAIGEEAETLTLIHDGEGDLDKRGTLHILAIGVNDYNGLGNICGDSGKESCDLTSAGADARTFVEAVEKRLGPAHERVRKRVLVNGGDPKDAPTAANITDAVELLRLSKENDTVVLFVAGHGSNEGPDYRFLATDASWMGGALRGSTVVPWQTLQGAVEAAKGRRILFIDTCHSGNAYNQRLGNAAYHANIIAYTAARFDQLALEDSTLGHGIFTYAVVEGLRGTGAVTPKGEISTKSLADYVVGRVNSLAKALNGEQEPQYFKGRDAQDFVLTRR